jgi:hypothetical protein
MQKGKLGQSHRDKKNETSRLYGSTFMHILRKISGAIFASGLPENTNISETLSKLDAASLSQMHRHHGDGDKRRDARAG